MVIERFKVLRGAVFVVAIGCLVLGVTLVVIDERANRRSDAAYLESQLALQSTFGVFDNQAASEPLENSVSDSTNQDSDGSDSDAQRREAVALVSIPRIGLDVAATSYRSYDDLRFAIGYMPESTPPNEPGITYFVGHRTGFGAPFRDLDKLQVGNILIVKNAAGVVEEYEVEFVEIRKPTDDIPELSRLNGVSNLLLVTCHPEFSTELRLIVGASGA